MADAASVVADAAIAAISDAADAGDAADASHAALAWQQERLATEPDSASPDGCDASADYDQASS